MTKRARNRAGCILLVIFGVILSVWFFTSDLKIRRFDLPALEAKKQSIMGIISMASANDLLLGESHLPVRETTFCLWGDDSWTYNSSRTRSELVNAFDQSFLSWRKWPSPTSGIFYNSGPFFVELEWNVSDANAANIYIVRLMTNDPQTPQCGPD